jgi:hypothetical protein
MKAIEELLKEYLATCSPETIAATRTKVERGNA